MKITITRKVVTRWETLYTAHAETEGKIIFLGKVITNDEQTALEYFRDRAREIEGRS